MIQESEKKKRVSKKQRLFIAEYKKKLFNVSATCEAMGMGRKTYYRWMNDKASEFSEMIELAKEEMIDMAESQLFINISKKDQRAIEFFLSRKARQRGYGEKLAIDGGEDDEGTKQPIVLKIEHRKARK